MAEESRCPHEAARDYGFNSPFEEFAFAFEMSRRSVRTVYPRAIYRTRHPRDSDRQMSDERRFAALADLSRPMAHRSCARNTITSPSGDFGTARMNCSRRRTENYYRAINVKRACADKLISGQTMEE